MRIVKNYVRLEGDGFSAERKLEQDPSGVIWKVGVETRLIPFAMDAEKKGFIIFMIPRKETVSLFLWVHLSEEKSSYPGGKRIRLTAVNELMQYTKWTGEPMDVSGKYPEEVISQALTLLQAWPLEDAVNAFYSFNSRLNEIGGVDNWRKNEADILKNVIEAKRDYKGLMYMF